MIKEEILELDEFMALARASHPDWMSEDDPQKCGWVFRGQKYCGANGVEWKLLPSAWRPATMKPYLDKLRGRKSPDGYQYESNEYELQLYETAFVLLVQEFIELSISIGLEIDVDFGENYVKRGALYKRPKKKSEIKFMELMGEYTVVQNAQHYGLPTPILDWSFSPAIALSHALGDNQRENEVDIVLWCLQRFENQIPKETGLLVFRPPRVVNPFLTAQKGLFTTVWGLPIVEDKGSVGLRSSKYFVKYGKWPSFEDWYEKSEFQDEAHRPQLRKLILKAKDVPDARNALRREGISSAHLKPTLENVAKVVMGDLGYREKKCKCKGTNS